MKIKEVGLVKSEIIEIENRESYLKCPGLYEMFHDIREV